MENIPMSILPVLPVADVPEAIEHYVSVLGFEEEFRMPNDDGIIVNGLVGRGDNRIMLNLNPKDADRNGGGIWLWLRVDREDIDALYREIGTNPAISVVEEIGDRFWGDRSFAIRDALGYTLAFNAKIDA